MGPGGSRPAHVVDKLMMKCSIAAISSGTSWWTPRRTGCLVRIENQISTMFIHDALVGVKWKCTCG